MQLKWDLFLKIYVELKTTMRIIEKLKSRHDVSNVVQGLRQLLLG